MYFTKDDNDFRVQCMKNIFYRKIRLDSIKETIIRKFTFFKSQNLKYCVEVLLTSVQYLNRLMTLSSVS